MPAGKGQELGLGCAIVTPSPKPWATRDAAVSPPGRSEEGARANVAARENHRGRRRKCRCPGLIPNNCNGTARRGTQALEFLKTSQGISSGPEEEPHGEETAPGATQMPQGPRTTEQTPGSAQTANRLQPPHQVHGLVLAAWSVVSRRPRSVSLRGVAGRGRR